jgi:uroporphyrinogen decarboxylase
MNSRERIKRIINGEEADRCGFWLGNPHPDSWPNLHAYFATKSDEELRLKLHDDFRWIMGGTYKHPEGKPIFEFHKKNSSHGAEGYFADCEDVQQVEDYNWPNPDYLDFTEVIDKLENSGDFYRASGFWSPFFHEMMDFFGMDNYFIKMYTHPEVVHSVTRHIVDFYLEANRRFFEAAGALIDGFFFGNDFGTQLNLFVKPDVFREFIFPYFRQLTELGHQYQYQVLLHSCGSIYNVIPDLISLGVEALHPLQAKAVNMEAERLAKDFKGNLAFMGGIDTQDLLVNGTPEEIREDVRRVNKLLGPELIISPSHEAILPSIPPRNIEAMADVGLRY